MAAMGPDSTSSSARAGRSFPARPSCFAGSTGEIEARSLPSHVTGVLLKREFSPTLDIALRLHPGTAR